MAMTQYVVCRKCGQSKSSDEVNADRVCSSCVTQRMRKLDLAFSAPLTWARFSRVFGAGE